MSHDVGPPIVRCRQNLPLKEVADYFYRRMVGNMFQLLGSTAQRSVALWRRTGGGSKPLAEA